MPRRTLARLAADARGLALTEFAFVFPVLLLLFLGGYQLMDALACKRKVSVTNRAIADLTTQSKAVDAAYVDSILDIATKIMAPYSATGAWVRVSQLTTDNSGATTVSWSRAKRGAKRAHGSSFTLPANLRVDNTSIIFAEITYTYDPKVVFTTVGQMSLTDSIYMNPRYSDTVSCDDC